MSKSFDIAMAAKGILLAVFLSLLFTVVLGLIYYFTSIQESITASLVTAGLSVLVASLYISYKTGSKGLYYGLAIGIGFFLLSIIIFYIFYIGNPSWPILLLKFLVSLITGIFGGTIGAILKG
ncbi:MAG: TIGR04086 family membrane protein [Peptococcaceae bacterium]|nr:TIGR04086 family membrane protein [Peptococcaceae bacterium]